MIDFAVKRAGTFCCKISKFLTFLFSAQWTSISLVIGLVAAR